MSAIRVLALCHVLVYAAALWYTFAGENDVVGAPLTCDNNTAPFRCLGTTSSIDECTAACLASPGDCMGVATWSLTSQHCWTRTDGLWAPAIWANAIAACDTAVVSTCAPWNGSALNVTIGGAAGPTMHPLAPAVTLDFWRSDDPTYGEKWGNSSALDIDLTSPVLQAAAKALSPALLRLGGSPEDSVVFDTDGTCVPGSGGSGPAPNGYYCSQVHPYVYDCMTPARWNALLAFAASTGLHIVLGLNACYGRMSADTPMNLTNIRALLTATAASPYASALWGFEFSNEIVPNTVSPTAWATDMEAIATAARSIFGAAGLPPPLLAGPDQGGCGALGDVVAAITPGTLFAGTYHQYPQCTAPAPSAQLVLEPSCLSSLDSQAAGCVAAVAPAAPLAPQVWAGETADHSGGGIANLTDTFRSSFYYAWQIGALPAAGVQLMARQCLSGGDYELLRRTDFSPNPDYWIIWAFKQVAGVAPTPLNVTASVAPVTAGVRVFAFARNDTGAVALMVVNLIATSQNVSISVAGAGAPGAPRVEWHFTGDVTVQHGDVAVNGVTLAMDPVTHAPPALKSLGVPTSGAMNIAPSSIVFALLTQ